MTVAMTLRSTISRLVCLVHVATTFFVSMSHNLIFPSPLPLATVFPLGDNAMLHTPTFSSSRQSLPTCTPLSRFHSRSEPSSEHVMMCRSSGRCATPVTQPVCPRIVWRGFIMDIDFILEVGGGGMVGAGHVCKSSQLGNVELNEWTFLMKSFLRRTYAIRR